MNILFIKHFFIGFMVSEIPRVSVFWHCPYSVTFPYCIQGIHIAKCSVMISATAYRYYTFVIRYL